MPYSNTIYAENLTANSFYEKIIKREELTKRFIAALSSKNPTDEISAILKEPLNEKASELTQRFRRKFACRFIASESPDLKSRRIHLEKTIEALKHKMESKKKSSEFFNHLTTGIQQFSGGHSMRYRNYLLALRNAYEYTQKPQAMHQHFATPNV